jgi:hypothetical protein
MHQVNVACYTYQYSSHADAEHAAQAAEERDQQQAARQGSLQVDTSSSTSTSNHGSPSHAAAAQHSGAGAPAASQPAVPALGEAGHDVHPPANAAAADAPQPACDALAGAEQTAASYSTSGEQRDTVAAMRSVGHSHVSAGDSHISSGQHAPAKFPSGELAALNMRSVGCHSSASRATSHIFDPSLSQEEVQQRIREEIGGMGPQLDLVSLSQAYTKLEKSIQEVCISCCSIVVMVSIGVWSVCQTTSCACIWRTWNNCKWCPGKILFKSTSKRGSCLHGAGGGAAALCAAAARR